MALITIDDERLETIALLLSGSTSLPHAHYRNRAKRFCYVLPVEDPTVLIYSLAFRTDNPLSQPNEDDLIQIPITGEKYLINGKECIVCSFIAYSIFNGNSILSTHCEKITKRAAYVSNTSSQKLLSLGTDELLTTPNLKVSNNVINLADRRK